MRQAEHHVIRAHDIMQVELAAEQIDREQDRTRHILPLDAASQAVARWIPGDDDAVARRRVALQQRHEVRDLVAMEVAAPAVAVRCGDDAVYICELVPDMRELREKIAGDALASKEPYLLGHEEANGDAAQREQRQLRGGIGDLDPATRKRA